MEFESLSDETSEQILAVVSPIVERTLSAWPAAPLSRNGIA